MTPIRIRGKKGQKARLRALQEQRAQRAANEESEIASTASAALLGPSLSRLESLPTELLESIFLYSQDVSLPRASLALGKALSSRHVKHKLLRSLLTDVDVEEAPIFSEGASGIAKLQSKLLKCRWLDLASFKRALAATFTSVVEDLVGKPRAGFQIFPLPIEPDTDDPLLMMSSVSQLVKYVLGLPLNHEPIPWSIDGPETTLTVTVTHTNVYILEPDLFLPFAVRGGCEMPTRLLHGPWTAEKMEFLEIMMTGGAVLDPESSNNQEVADQSLREAIIQGNLSIVRILCRQWENQWSGYMSKVPLVLDHVRLAIFQGGCKPDILDLLATRWRNIPQVSNKEKIFDWKQDDILDWAHERRECGDERGPWLLELMDTLEMEKRMDRFLELC
ncbi:MAG: hypothetical protein LQ338_007711 [Usnochroma carphineum]|nr:MAG: hypothetical protein LQ338_007711 [Usnochroma carphineum]